MVMVTVIHCTNYTITLGVFCYNMAKFRENVAKDSLPVSMPKTNKAKPIWENHYTLDNSKVNYIAPV